MKVLHKQHQLSLILVKLDNILGRKWLFLPSDVLRLLCLNSVIFLQFPESSLLLFWSLATSQLCQLTDLGSDGVYSAVRAALDRREEEEEVFFFNVRG